MNRRRNVLALAGLALSGGSLLANASPAAADSNITDSRTFNGGCQLTMVAKHITNNSQQRLTVSLTMRGINGSTDAECAPDNMYANVTYDDPQGVQRVSGAQTSDGNSLFASYDGVPGGARVDSFWHARVCAPDQCNLSFSTNTSPK